MTAAARIALEEVVEPFFDLEDLYKMTAAGVFPEGRNVELVDGRLYMAPSEGTPHFRTNGFAAAALHRLIGADPGLDATVHAFSNGTLHLARGRVVNPDTVVLPISAVQIEVGAPKGSDVLLAVEVADTSIRYDEGTKLAMYAEAGVQELWIVRLRKRDIRILREPADGQYLSERLIRNDETVSPLFAPNASVRASDLFRF